MRARPAVFVGSWDATAEPEDVTAVPGIEPEHPAEAIISDARIAIRSIVMSLLAVRSKAIGVVGFR